MVGTGPYIPTDRTSFTHGSLEAAARGENCHGSRAMVGSLGEPTQIAAKSGAASMAGPPGEVAPRAASSPGALPQSRAQDPNSPMLASEKEKGRFRLTARAWPVPVRSMVMKSWVG
ncbi:MAG: hypothetical protein KGI54_18740 [Pseudomonadota bacterium]|nr:hypothetical protein [Pseudomonadota bacterium]